MYQHNYAAIHWSLYHDIAKSLVIPITDNKFIQSLPIPYIEEVNCSIVLLKYGASHELHVIPYLTRQ